ncbi:MAG TPA: hypothetical protein DCY88_29650 [Cyanobacteria bacterium UBA11372]|nr:hypothetical protein [Cyanobacteria bacterium UBA11372]
MNYSRLPASQAFAKWRKASVAAAKMAARTPLLSVYNQRLQSAIISNMLRREGGMSRIRLDAIAASISINSLA